MKSFFLAVLITFCGALNAQNRGLIVGNIIDTEQDNTQLAFANISIKNTDITATTDFSGLFLIENLESGDYTLVCTFPGYKTKEIQISVSALNTTELKFDMSPLPIPSMSTALNSKPSSNAEIQSETNSHTLEQP